MRDLWLELHALAASGAEGASVTVCRTAGSAYQREGAKLLYRRSAPAIGTVSGGCLEADVFEHCEATIRAGEPRIVRYETGGVADAVFGVGTGCQGTIDLLVEPVASWRAPGAAALLREIVDRVGRRERFVVASLLRGDGDIPRPIAKWLVDARGVLAAGGAIPEAIGAAARAAVAGSGRRSSRNVLLESDGRRLEVLLDVHAPPLRLVVFGAGDDARPLVRIAADVGMDVTVLDWREELLRRERFADAVELVRVRPEGFPGGVSLADRPAVVLMTHNYAADAAALAAIARRGEPLGYLGVLGPRARTARLVDELGETFASAEPLASIRTPAGLDVGADSPAEIALSIVAEILAVWKGRSGGSLAASRGGD